MLGEKVNDDVLWVGSWYLLGGILLVVAHYRDNEAWSSSVEAVPALVML